MRFHRPTLCFAASVLMIGIHSIAHGQATATHADAHAWLQRHAIPLEHLGLTEDDQFEDLAPLAEHIGDARIVMLGEQTHGDGAAFLAKTRLIAFLHERMGFDVLCFESGMFECEHAWKRISAGDDVRASIESAVFPIWTRSQQFVPLIDYIAVRSKADLPLEVAGYDCQLTGAASREWPNEVRAVLAWFPHDQPPADSGGVEDLVDRIVNHGKLDHLADAASLRGIAATLRNPDTEVDATPVERSRAAQLFDSLAGAVEARIPSEDGVWIDAFNARDAAGADNLHWLATERYPDRRIIVWCASMHMLRDHGAIDTRTESLDYTGLRSMGDRASEQLGDDAVYSIACTTYSGNAGLPWAEPWFVSPAPAGSFEALCHEAGLDNAFVPLGETDGAAPLDGEFTARPLGNAPMNAVWSRHTDAFLFQRAMTPSTQFREPVEISRVDDFIGVLKESVANDRKRHADGNVWADKGNYNHLYDRWYDDAAPDAKTRTKQRHQIRVWGEPLLDDPAIAWRVRMLFAHVARQDGKFDTALRELDAALEAYGVRTHENPIKHSSRQHIVNERAMTLWDRDGFNAALLWATEAVENDRGLLYFHTIPWVMRLANDQARIDELEAAIDAAYARRIDAILKSADELAHFREVAVSNFDRTR